MRRFLHLCLNRTPIIGVLMAALLFRALIPAGFMPMLASDGTIVMELCSGFTTKSVVVNLAAPADSAGHVEHAVSEGARADAAHGDLFENSPCGFAAAASAAGPPSLLAAIAPIAPQIPLAALHAAAETPPSIYRSQTPRGPPLA
jgi:hypothetical protein